jgi:hypothetical protein
VAEPEQGGDSGEVVAWAGCFGVAELADRYGLDVTT